jgi:hypothetical protein
MAQRVSGKERIKHDAYQTPPWVTDCVIAHLPSPGVIGVVHEPAAGNGKMLRALRKHGYICTSGDIQRGNDFLQSKTDWPAIVTNPPFNLAREFIEHALARTESRRGVVAMLLRVDYDSAATRSHLFAGHPAFHKKIVLTKRIRWIEGSTGSPSENHAWFLWDWQNLKPPTIGYAP